MKRKATLETGRVVKYEDNMQIEPGRPTVYAEAQVAPRAELYSESHLISHRLHPVHFLLFTSHFTYFGIVTAHFM